MNRANQIASDLKAGSLSLSEFEAMLLCAYDSNMRGEQIILQAAAELAGARFEAKARRIADQY